MPVHIGLTYMGITAGFSFACAVSAHFKYGQMMQLVRQGIAPDFNDCLVHQSLMGASVLFGLLGTLAIVLTSWQYLFGH